MKRRRVRSVLPAGYLAAALVLAVAVLPTVLRPPPEQQQSSAALNPNAPPEEEAETILQSLQQAASRTAGATGGQQTAVATTTTSTVVLPSRGRCFGEPPRQTESPYSPPCRAAFTGDNGGDTWKNVTGDEIRVAYWYPLGMPPASQRGFISDTPQEGESAEYRTARVIQQYFNERYELYGRRLKLYAIPDDGATEAELHTAAVRVDSEAKAFAAIHLEDPFCKEVARRDLVCFSGNPHLQSLYDTYAPKWWSYQMGSDKVDRMTAEYICKKLVGRNADFAGLGVQGKPRKIAVVVDSVPNNDFRSYRAITGPARELCGFEEVIGIDFDGRDPAQTALAVSQASSEGATTIVLVTGLTGALTMFSAADSSGYFPEWVQVNSYGLDFNDVARLLPPSQTAHLFGMSGWELPCPTTDTDCYRGYKSVDPTGAADSSFCTGLWISIEHVLNGIQEAGPDLAPESFRNGMYSMPLDTISEPWAIGGGYGPGDHDFVDDLVEIWWDGACTDPDGELGCYRHTAGGRRWRAGALDDVVRVFAEGIAGDEDAG